MEKHPYVLFLIGVLVGGLVTALVLIYGVYGGEFGASLFKSYTTPTLKSTIIETQLDTKSIGPIIDYQPVDNDINNIGPIIDY